MDMGIQPVSKELRHHHHAYRHVITIEPNSIEVELLRGIDGGPAQSAQQLSVTMEGGTQDLGQYEYELAVVHRSDDFVFDKTAQQLGTLLLATWAHAPQLARQSHQKLAATRPAPNARESVDWFILRLLR